MTLAPSFKTINMKQKYKIFLVNPKNISMESLFSAVKGLPIGIVTTNTIKNIKIVDTGIFVEKKEK